MFSIFGTSGALFKGPMEDLIRVSGVLPAAHTRRIDPLLAHMDDVERRSHYTNWPKSAPRQPDAPPPHVNRQSVQATGEYARMQRPLTPPRRVLHTVQDVMSVRVISVGKDQSIQQGWQVLADAGVGQAPVVGVSGELVGLFSRAELFRLDQLPSPEQGALVWRTWLSLPLTRIMTSPVPAVYPETDLRRLAQVLLYADL
ncbi:MAG: CBS domain-containing protein, partial [Burkholderiales bacterium]|nr:CBS domain-containing protein [Burkholderiales bacterium]